MDFESRVLIFMFFNCTMVRDIHTMGKILLPYTLEILTHLKGRRKILLGLTLPPTSKVWSKSG